MTRPSTPALMSRVAAALLAASTLLFPRLALADERPPAAVPGALVTDYHGVRVADPYRDLEDLQAPATQAWAKAQAAFTRRTLDALPGRAALLSRIEALDKDQPPAIAALSITPRGQWFYLKRMPGESVPRLYVRERAGAPERLLLDPQAWRQRTGVPHSINNFAPSPDGRHVAAVVSKADAELGEMQVFDSRSGTPVGAPIPGIWGELPAVWLRTGQAFLYARGADALTPGGQPFGKMVVHEHRLKGGPDRPVAGWQLAGPVAVREADWLGVDTSSSPDFALAFANEGVSSNLRAYVAPQARGGGSAVGLDWRPVFGEEASVRGYALWRHLLYVLTFDQAARYRVMRYDLRERDAKPVEVVPQGAGVIEGIAAASDGLYVVMRTGSLSDLLYLPHGDGRTVAPLRTLGLPFAGAVNLLANEPSVPGAVVTLEGWTREWQVLRVRGDQGGPQGRAGPTALAPPREPTVAADWVSEESNCTSHDGTEVPMSIIHKRGLVRDGSHPTLMDGYGGYGVPEPAFFYNKLDPLLQRGGIFVTVKPRGGGAFGREWYQAGVGPRKANTWKDMIACAQALVQRGYTSVAKLAIQGTSMGGVAVGRAVTERPELFGIAIMRVGVLDALRFIESTPNGPNHELEMGSIKDAEGVRQLLAMSTYHQVKDGVRYPATLLTTGLNDNRVAPGLILKTHARLAAATSSGAPVLLRLDEEGGHGISNTAQQRNAELADRLAFLLWQAGDADFQPPAAAR